jgi:micrococcal nuclease
VVYGLLIAAGALFAIVGMLFLAGGVEGLFERAGSAERPGAQAPPFTPPSRACDASYQGVCVPPPPPDLDCPDLVDRGIPLPVTVVGSDPHDLDPDGDGLGC